jgi:DNA invertase Pin-like site-specific DNA recombinase
MTNEYTTEHDAAIALLDLGMATPSEIARLAGVSRQLVLHWAKRADINWRRARDERLAREWGKRTQP